MAPLVHHLTEKTQTMAPWHIMAPWPVYPGRWLTALAWPTAPACWPVASMAACWALDKAVPRPSSSWTRCSIPVVATDPRWPISPPLSPCTTRLGEQGRRRLLIFVDVCCQVSCWTVESDKIKSSWIRQDQSFLRVSVSHVSPRDPLHPRWCSMAWSALWDLMIPSTLHWPEHQQELSTKQPPDPWSPSGDIPSLVADSSQE